MNKEKEKEKEIGTEIVTETALKAELKSISEPALRRLPLYHQYLKKAHSQGVKEISSTRIAEELNLTSILVRKDIAYTSILGKPKTGYNVESLILAIEEFLGWKNNNEALLIGAGNLGIALLGYKGFKDYGLSIVAAFDTDEKKIGETIYGKKIMSIEKFENITKRLKIRIGIITVPAEFAQEVADLMVKSGIKAIWNFSPVKVSVPDDVKVQHVNLASSIALLLRSIE